MKVVPATPENIARAADELRQGRLVVMPTETVYGLAGSVWHQRAIDAIFSAKARPPDNPLIVHLADLDQVRELTVEVTNHARALMRAFWPGPLTLVLRKSDQITRVITGGGDTVALRMPSHPVAQHLLGLCKTPLAAPSANRFTALSPTRAEDVSTEILDQVAMVLDGGPCEVGIESTIVDCTSASVRLLRPGGIARAKIEECVGPLEINESLERRAPGNYPRHYSPKAGIILCGQIPAAAAGLTFRQTSSTSQIQMPCSAQEYAAKLYASLHRLDALSPGVIYVETPPRGPQWAAVWDRLTRASHVGISEP